MTAGIQKESFLNREECWKDWVIKFGSLGKVQNDHILRKIVNPSTGRVATKMGIKFAALHWATDYPEEARKDLTWAWEKKGRILDDETWKKWLANSARLRFQTNKEALRLFIARHGLQNYA